MALKAPEFQIGSSYCVTFSPDGEHLAAVGRDVVLWSVGTRKRLRSSRMLRHPSAVAFSPNGSAFVVKNTCGELLLCDAATADPITRFASADSDEGAAPVFASADRIMDGSWTGEIRARDVANLTPRILWSEAHRMVVQVLHSSRTWACVVTVKHSDPTHDPDVGGDQILVAKSSDALSFRAVDRTWYMLRSAALSPEGDRVAVRYGIPDQRVELVDLATSRVIANAPSIAGGTGHHLTWSPDGRVIVLVEEGGFSVRHAGDLSEIGKLPSLYPSHVDFSPDGQLVAMGDWRKGLVRSWPAVLAELTDAPEMTPAP